jgi:hypothetical protein
LKEKKDALKGRKVFIYSRVSTEEQKGTLKTQTKAIERGLANLGFKGKAEVFEEQESGTKIDRPVLQELIKKAMSSKRPAVIVVRDIQRFSRDPYDLGELYNPLKAALSSLPQEAKKSIQDSSRPFKALPPQEQRVSSQERHSPCFQMRRLILAGNFCGSPMREWPKPRVHDDWVNPPHGGERISP